MKVGIIRNAEAEANAGIIRITDALVDMGAKPIIISRSRFNENHKDRFIKKIFKHKTQQIPNFEMQIQTKVGRGMKNILQLFMYQFYTLRWLLKNREKLDIIHAFDLDAGIPALIFAKLAKKKIVYHVADFYIDSRQGIPSILKRIIKTIEYHLISEAETTIICTEERKNQIKGSNPKKLYVIHNSPVEELQVEKNEVKKRKFSDNRSLLTLGYVGGLSDKRFIDKVLNFVKENPRVTLKIAGFGRIEKSVEEAASKFNNIYYYGRISYKEALKLYSQCDLMFAMYDPTVPNHKYSAPNKVYEAMMLGLPIIVTKGTGIDSLVETEQIGFSIDYSVEEFSDTVKYLIENEGLLKTMKSNSEQAYSRYSWKNMKKKVQEIYTDL